MMLEGPGYRGLAQCSIGLEQVSVILEMPPRSVVLLIDTIGGFLLAIVMVESKMSNIYCPARIGN